MTARFKDDSYRRPNLGFDGMVPELLQSKPKPETKPKPWWELDEIKNWSPPTYPTLPRGWTPQLPSPRQGPSPFPDPLPVPPPHDVDPPKHPNSLVTENPSGRTEDTIGNWLQSYGQNGDAQRGLISPGPGAPATGPLPAESSGGLLGMLYEMMRQGEQTPDGGVVPNPQDASQQASPERWLGRRTYRA
jgi:hypothetical protein